MSRSELPLLTDEIIENIPNVNILVVGKAGVGKTQLIKFAFNVPDIEPSHTERGQCSIRTRLTSPHNKRFVLHDSMGFEPGDGRNFQIVMDFIDDMSRKTIADRLHAIWLCIEIPIAGGRLLQSAEEELIRKDLGDTPLIVVFTKYDKLLDDVEFLLMKQSQLAGRNEMEVLDLIINGAKEKLNEICFMPLAEFDPRIPSTAVSSEKPRYLHTIAKLIEMTEEAVQHKTSGDLWMVWAIAQRASFRSNIELSIEVGIRRYWQGLSSGFHFRNHSLKKCLDAIHDDIIRSWNFLDDNELLFSEEFRQKIVALAEPVTQALQTTISDTSMNARVGVATALGPHVGTATAAFLLSTNAARWAYEVYKETPGTLCSLMAYIVDLVAVVSELFWITLAPPNRGTLTQNIIHEALDSYKSSGGYREIHQSIRYYVDNTSFLKHLERTNAHEEVVRLIRAYSHIRVLI